MSSEFLSREELLAPDPPRTKIIAIPELGGKQVRVRALTAGERADFKAQFIDRETGELDVQRMAESDIRLCAESVVDANGNRLFGPEDVEALKQKNPAIIARIADAAARLSRLGKYENMKALLGNSDETTSAAGSSGI